MSGDSGDNGSGERWGKGVGPLAGWKSTNLTRGDMPAFLKAAGNPSLRPLILDCYSRPPKRRQRFVRKVVKTIKQILAARKKDGWDPKTCITLPETIFPPVSIDLPRNDYLNLDDILWHPPLHPPWLEPPPEDPLDLDLDLDVPDLLAPAGGEITFFHDADDDDIERIVRRWRDDVQAPAEEAPAFEGSDLGGFEDDFGGFEDTEQQGGVEQQQQDGDEQEQQDHERDDEGRYTVARQIRARAAAIRSLGLDLSLFDDSPPDAASQQLQHEPVTLSNTAPLRLSRLAHALDDHASDCSLGDAVYDDVSTWDSYGDGSASEAGVVLLPDDAQEALDAMWRSLREGSVAEEEFSEWNGIVEQDLDGCEGVEGVAVHDKALGEAEDDPPAGFEAAQAVPALASLALDDDSDSIVIPDSQAGSDYAFHIPSPTPPPPPPPAADPLPPPPADTPLPTPPADAPAPAPRHLRWYTPPPPPQPALSRTPPAPPSPVVERAAPTASPDPTLSPSPDTGAPTPPAPRAARRPPPTHTYSKHQRQPTPTPEPECIIERSPTPLPRPPSLDDALLALASGPALHTSSKRSRQYSSSEDDLNSPPPRRPPRSKRRFFLANSSATASARASTSSQRSTPAPARSPSRTTALPAPRLARAFSASPSPLAGMPRIRRLTPVEQGHAGQEQLRVNDAMNRAAAWGKRR
ncbi:hypothetical protein JCM10207_005218 [Rhodosporidiobolus poonsookiae]